MLPKPSGQPDVIRRARLTSGSASETVNSNRPSAPVVARTSGTRVDQDPVGTLEGEPQPRALSGLSGRIKNPAAHLDRHGRDRRWRGGLRALGGSLGRRHSGESG